MKALIFDSETTGKALWKEPADDPRQPRIVQLGAILYDDERRVVAEMNLVVRPDGWTVPAEAAAIHGFTTERAGAVRLRIVEGRLALGSLGCPGWGVAAEPGWRTMRAI